MDGQDPQSNTQSQDPQAGAPVPQASEQPGQAAPIGGGQQTGTGDSSQPPADQGGAATGGKGDEESFLRPRPPDSELGIGTVGGFATSVAIPAHPNTTFDEAYFLKMLSGSISLTKNEKKKIVDSIGKLSQYQIDELIKIFEEERRKFAELDEKHQVKIRELQSKQEEDWKDMEMEEQQTGKVEEDAAAAEALKAQLMGGAPASTAESEDEQPPEQAA